MDHTHGQHELGHDGGRHLFGRGGSGAVFPPPAPTVEEAKLRLLEWGVAADEDFRADLEDMKDGLRNKVRSAMPWAAGLAGVWALFKGFKSRGKRRREEEETPGQKTAKTATKGAIGVMITALGVARAGLPILRAVMAYRAGMRQPAR